jgi:shikimate kinase
MLIFLIGMPGSGKSYWMRKFAAATDYVGQDTDWLTEQRTGKRIAELFEQGENIFRSEERRTLEDLMKKAEQPMIIATGGGTPCFFDNMDLMLGSGLVIYLQAALTTLSYNLRRSYMRRPLLDGKAPEELELFLNSLLAERRKYYERATLHLNVEHLQPLDFVTTVQSYIKSYYKQ